MKKILIGILSAVVIIAILIGGKIYMDSNKMENIVKSDKAKEVIEDLLEKNFNCKCAVSYLEDNFCFYQRAGTLIEGYGTIDRSFKDYRAFLKDYLGKCSIGK